MRHRWLPAAAVALLFVISLAAVTSSNDFDSPRARPEGRLNSRYVYRGPQVEAPPNPFGLKWNWTQLRALRPHLADTAGGATFHEVVWCDVERSRGRRNWELVDAVALATPRLGYELFLKIRVGSCWVNGKSARSGSGQRKQPSFPPEDLHSYRGFVSAVVERYSGRGVKAFAIENEVNARNFWRGTPLEYERMVTVASEAVRAADPAARVLDSGISSIGYGVAMATALVEAGHPEKALSLYQRYYERRYSEPGFVFRPVDSARDLHSVLDSEPARRAREFLDATVRLVGAGRIDAFQLHFYEPWFVLPQLLDHLRERLGTEFPIEAWEVGIAWPGESFDPQEQAFETVKLLSTLLGGGVRRAIYLPAAYTPGGLRPNEIWRGLYLPDGEPRPAAGAYARLVNAASGPGLRWQSVDAPRVQGVGFDRSGAATLFIWSQVGTVISGPPPPGTRASRIDGTPRAWGAVGLEVGPDPILLEWPEGLDAALSRLS